MENKKASSSDSVMIIAAEASSVTYAQRLISELKQLKPGIEFFGVGSRQMEAQGFKCLGYSEDMAIVGFVEVVQHYSFIKKIFDSLIEEVKVKRPKVVVLMDYPEFNLRLARALHPIGIPVVYYISPQIWVWRQGRVEWIKKYCRKVLLLFPFEKKFYDQHQVPNEFVGHPLLDELEEKYFDPIYFRNHRQRYGLSDKDIVLGLMPGSRRSEVAQHFAIQLETARILARRHENLKILIMVAPSFSKEDLLPYLEDFRLPYILLKDEPFEMIHLTDLVLVASGTATLMVGLLQKPMVIMYRVKWLTGVIAKWVVKGVKYFGMVNLIANKELVPECFQKQTDPENLAKHLEKYILEPEYRKNVEKELGEIIHTLGNPGVSQRVALSLTEYFQDNSCTSEKSLKTETEPLT